MSLSALSALEVSGQQVSVPCIDGSERRYVNLDNAATTPPLMEVAETVAKFTDWYSSVHRGTGFKSQLSSVVFDEARRIIGDFVGVDWETQTLIFCQHTTEAVNRLSRRILLEPSDLILNTVVEHHANLIPWSQTGQVVHVELENEGMGPGLDLDGFERLLREYAGRVKLLAVTGASNMTGYMPPIHDLAELAHRYGALIFVDGAQLLPHRPVDLRATGDPGHIDFLAFSGHKMYAPYGVGGLVAPKDVLAQGTPFMLGGGAVRAVRLDDVLWEDLPEREEAGTPNLVGIVALARACQVLSDVGMDVVAEHERELTRHALIRLQQVPGLTLFGDSDPEIGRDRVAVFSFMLRDYSHAHLAAILGYEYAIAVRNGCFCAHPYVKRLAGVDDEADSRMWLKVAGGDNSDLPGFVRASAGCYTKQEDLDALAESLIRIAEKGPAVTYHEDRATGEYLPVGYSHNFGDYFTL